MGLNQSAAGIYKVTCGNRFYIGSTIKFSARRYLHLWFLKKGSHHNKALQEAYNEAQSFRFSIIEEMPCHNELREREQHYIESFMPNPLCCNEATAHAPYMDEDEYQRLKLQTPGRYSRSEETKRRIAESKIGALNHKSRPVIITHPKGEETEFPSATAAAKYFNVTQQAFHNWISGKIAWPGKTHIIHGAFFWEFKARFKDGPIA